jgi:hypothetical protein
LLSGELVAEFVGKNLCATTAPKDVADQPTFDGVLSSGDKPRLLETCRADAPIPDRPGSFAMPGADTFRCESQFDQVPIFVRTWELPAGSARGRCCLRAPAQGD